jgi:Tfp pilus assembly protein PilV
LLKLCWQRITCRCSRHDRDATSAGVASSRTFTEQGFALLDVAVAILVLMVILLPIAYLLSSTSTLAASNQHRLTAQSLAASWLEQERTSAGQSATSPPSVSSPVGALPTSWPSAAGTEQVGGITYDIYVAGGWCAYSGTGSRWNDGVASTTTTNVAPPPLTYFIAAKVKWGPAAANPNQIGGNDAAVVEYSSVQSQSGWLVTVSGTQESVLTLTTTVGITGNVCPLGLS